MRPVELQIGDRQVRCYALQIKNELWLHFDGQTHVVDLNPARKNKGGAKKESNGEITAPMPGKIMKVNCKAGEDVQEKQALVVMEAMKMEYTLSADFTGKVKRVNVNEGDQVELGQLLVELEKK